MAFFDTFMIKRTINEEIIILLLQQVKIGDDVTSTNQTRARTWRVVLM